MRQLPVKLKKPAELRNDPGFRVEIPQLKRSSFYMALQKKKYKKNRIQINKNGHSKVSGVPDLFSGNVFRLISEEFFLSFLTEKLLYPQ
jgi:hypothetical protein